MTRAHLRFFRMAIAALSILWCSDALAHKDRIFPIDEQGNIEGMAEEFSPASLVVRPSETNELD